MSDLLLTFIQVRAGMMQRIKKQRYTVPDVFRGVAVLTMIVYHTMWDIVYLFGVSIPWFKTDVGFVFQQSICWSFILISGFCQQLGRKRLKRSIIILSCSVVLTVVTAVFMPDSIIIHGVLSLIGASMLLTIPLVRVLKKIPPLVGIVISFLVFLLLYNVPYGSIGIGEYKLIELPDFLYANVVTAFFGFPHKDFFSADYVPLIPWLFLFLTGYFIYSLIEKKGRMNVLSAFSCRPLEFIGRHSLEIYMLHQPLIYAVLMLIFKLI